MIEEVLKVLYRLSQLTLSVRVLVLLPNSDRINHLLYFLPRLDHNKALEKLSKLIEVIQNFILLQHGSQFLTLHDEAAFFLKDSELSQTLSNENCVLNIHRPLSHKEPPLVVHDVTDLWFELIFYLPVRRVFEHFDLDSRFGLLHYLHSEFLKSLDVIEHDPRITREVVVESEDELQFVKVSL